MDEATLRKAYEMMCAVFGGICKKCPIRDYRMKLGATRCADFINDHPEEAVLVIERFIAGDFAFPKTYTSWVKNPETRREILRAADRCVCGDRDNQYGSPENSFKAIASMWNSYLYAKGLIENNSTEWKGIVPQDVAAMMVLFKMARVATGQNKADNWIDGAGYCACGGEIAANKESG